MDETIRQTIITQMQKPENKETLITIIRDLTGIEYPDIEFKQPTGERLKQYIRFETKAIVPEMGIVGRYIRNFEFSMSSDCAMDENSTLLYFMPSLSYSIINGGSNGFSLHGVIIYNTKYDTWSLRRN